MVSGSKAGTYDMVTLPSDLKLVGNDAANYVLIQPTAPVKTSVVISELERDIDIQNDITEVPAGLKETSFNTVDAIKTELQRVMEEKLPGMVDNAVVFYDVTMKINTATSETPNWVDAKEENFPTEGITVTLDYPSGTSENIHEFVVAHMFSVTSSRLGTTAGDVETPEVTLDEDGAGITVTLKGLSPVAIGYKVKESGDNIGDNDLSGGVSPGGGVSGGESGGITPGGGVSGGESGGITPGGSTSGGTTSNGSSFDNDSSNNSSSGNGSSDNEYSENSSSSGTSSGKSSGSTPKKELVTGTWKQDETGWWYQYPGGTYEAGRYETDSQGRTVEYVSWKKIQNVWRAFGADGYLKEGWVFDVSDGHWYFTDVDAGMLTGWYLDPTDGYWYYLDPESGKMLTGWQLVGDKWYYLNPVSGEQLYRYDSQSGKSIRRPYGSMYYHEMTPDGYFVKEDGSWKE